MRMALAPAEVFEHAHLTESVTVLLEGEVDIIVDGQRERLVQGVPRRVPANVSHTLVNVGRVTAVVECGHDGTAPPTAP